mgnify:CR=1 FL=1
MAGEAFAGHGDKGWQLELVLPGTGKTFDQFTVDDPTLYAKTWSGEIALNASQQPLYEYACHEGNYALPSILNGARALDREGREQPPIKEAYPGVDVSEGQ